MAPKKQVEQDELMIVNDSPGEECRIAILQHNHLEELFTERTATATDVGNIYKGRVTNVEPAIQAAFIDYGQGTNGFLHISDLHPKHFPGQERTERVGKKIPRRERPPIQAALRRGDEILVQVLKEGIGTKGPTLTSYLSIPGRLLVLMPDMDRVGVSRKVEDEQKRREMREILDSLGLPDGFGFILRTAGYGKSKTELKRDAAYLMRMWKMMEKRIAKVGAPCELYTESDLLIRTVRDVLRPSIKAIIVDSESAFERISMFLRVVTPRSAPKVIRYRRPAPIFHAFDIERQIELIHSREVPLPSGGRLVIDQTEALVAIDVNSGRSRSARDSETNAYETNVEATDEICRQLRLRDLGGLIVNDLIDMRFGRNRKAIEDRFAANLKRDRAKATALPISEFGILEMTRQRMRPSLRKSHFMPCPHCNGHGEIKAPEYVAADAARHAGFLLQFERVARVELVCSPRVASVLLSGKRREMVRLEDTSGKRIDVRVSDAIAVDRVDYYAYDQRNADIDIAKLPALQAPSISELEAEQLLPPPKEAAAERGPETAGADRVRYGPADAGMIGEFDDEEFAELDQEQETGQAVGAPGQAAAPQERHGRRRRRRRRGGARFDGQHAQANGEQKPAAMPMVPAADADAWATPEPEHAQAQPDGATAPPGGHKKSRRRRGRRGRGRRNGQPTQGEHVPAAQHAAGSPSEAPQHDSADGQNVRIHELAKELSVTARELIDRVEPEPSVHHLTNALSTVSPDEAQSIRDIFALDASGQASGPVGQPQGQSRRSRRRRGRRGRGGASAQAAAPTEHQPTEPAADLHQANGGTGNGGQRRSRRRRRGRQRGGPPESIAHAAGPAAAAVQLTAPPATAAAPSTATVSAKKPRRSLYRAARGSVSPAARERAVAEED